MINHFNSWISCVTLTIFSITHTINGSFKKKKKAPTHFNEYSRKAATSSMGPKNKFVTIIIE